MEQAYSIKLPQFEGPLDLLLHLIKENKIDIYDIPIALITRQYLEYIDLMKDLNLEIAGDFLVMAATLVHIKSRMLLPIEEVADTEEPEDPRLELVMKLLEYKAFKEAAMGLSERENEWFGVFYRTQPEEEKEAGEAVIEGEEAEQMLFDLNLYDLIAAFGNILKKAPPEVLAITREALSIKDKMSVIIDAIDVKQAVRFEDLFVKGAPRSHHIVTFIALLELIRLGVAKAYQERDFGSIWIIHPEAKAPAMQKIHEEAQRAIEFKSPHSLYAEAESIYSAAGKRPRYRRVDKSNAPLPERPGMPSYLDFNVGDRLPKKIRPIF